VFASAPELQHPEAITWLGSTCYVASAGNGSIVALDSQGKVQQVLHLASSGVPCVTWGMTAWKPHSSNNSSCGSGATAAAAPAAANQAMDAAAAGGVKGDSDRGAAAAVGGAGCLAEGGAALYLASDVEYVTARWVSGCHHCTQNMSISVTYEAKSGSINDNSW
jgi:hypothetical protein